MEKENISIYAFIYLFSQLQSILGQLYPIYKLILYLLFNYKNYIVKNKENKNKLISYCSDYKLYIYI